MNANVETPDGDPQIAKVYEVMLKLISTLGNAKESN